MISIFKEMGFSHDRALRLLRQHDNNFYEAVDSLVSPESSEASPDSRSTFLHLSQDSALEGFSGGSTGSGGNCIACGVPFEKVIGVFCFLLSAAVISTATLFAAGSRF